MKKQPEAVEIDERNRDKRKRTIGQ